MVNSGSAKQDTLGGSAATSNCAEIAREAHEMGKAIVQTGSLEEMSLLAMR